METQDLSSLGRQTPDPNGSRSGGTEHRGQLPRSSRNFPLVAQNSIMPTLHKEETRAQSQGRCSDHREQREWEAGLRQPFSSIRLRSTKTILHVW